MVLLHSPPTALIMGGFFLSRRPAPALLEGPEPSEADRKSPVLIVSCCVLIVISHLMPIFCVLSKASALPITYTTATCKPRFGPF